MSDYWLSSDAGYRGRSNTLLLVILEMVSVETNEVTHVSPVQRVAGCKIFGIGCESSHLLYQEL